MLMKIVIDGKVIVFRKVEPGLMDGTVADKGDHCLPDGTPVWFWH